MTDVTIRTMRRGDWPEVKSIYADGIQTGHATSIRLHERHGFRVVGTRERIALMTYGSKAGRWRDTVFLERRSAEH